MSLVRFRLWALWFNTNGVLAQSVEHLTFNQVVRGSNPRCLMNEMKRKTLWNAGFPLFCYLSVLFEISRTEGGSFSEDRTTEDLVFIAGNLLRSPDNTDSRD